MRHRLVCLNLICYAIFVCSLTFAQERPFAFSCSLIPRYLNFPPVQKYGDTIPVPVVRVHHS